MNKKLLDSELQKMSIELRNGRLKLGVLQNEVKTLSYKKIKLTEDIEELEAKNRMTVNLNEKLNETKSKLAKEANAFEKEIRNKKDIIEQEQYKIDLEREELRKELATTREQRKLMEDAKNSFDERKKVLAKNIEETNKEQNELSKIIEENNTLQVTLNRKIKEADDKIIEFKRKSEQVDRQTKRLEHLLNLNQIEADNLRASKKEYNSKIRDIEKEEKINLELQADLKIKIEEADKEKVEAKRRQTALDKNLYELENDRNRIEVMKLKVEKLIRDNDAIKEIASLKKELHK